jgi:uncharacterized protein (UPF0212 family)
MKFNKVMEGPRDGEIRCQACFTRFRPKLGAGRAKCPHCGAEWRLSWPYAQWGKLSTIKLQFYRWNLHSMSRPSRFSRMSTGKNSRC